MAGKTVTLVMNGEVPLEIFAEAVGHFQRLIRALSRELGPRASVRWVLSDMEFGSADMSFSGDSDTPEVVEGVGRAFVSVGDALSTGRAIPYSPRVIAPARALGALVGDFVTSIEFRADDEHATVFSGGSTPAALLLGAYGAISGLVETLRMRGGLRFTLYDDIFDLPVRCSLRPNQSDLMRDAWGRKAIVEGWVERNSLTGVPARVSDIVTIQLLSADDQGGYWQAAGVSPYREGEMLPEELIRAVRDAQ